MKHSFKTLLTLALALVAGNAWGESGKYVKVTSTADLVDGKYLIVCEGENVAFNGGLGTLDAVSNTVAVTISNGEIASSTAIDAAAFTFTASDGSFLGTGGKYFGNASNSNALTSSATALTNTVSISDGNADIVSAGGAYLRYNKTSGQTRFRYYKSSSYTGQQPVQLYKYVSGTTPSKELVDIVVSGAPTQKTYEVGDSFDPAGLVVTGTYSDATTDDLTENAVWTITPATFTATTETSVSVTAKVGTISSAAYNVTGLTVNEHVVTPGTYDIVPTNTFFGVEVQTTGKHDPVTGTQNDITIVHSGGSSFYSNDNQTRAYTGNTLTFSVPAGYVITAIVFTASGSTWAGTHTASVGTMSDTKHWTGSANEVTITFGGTCRIANISVTFAVSSKTLTSVAVSGTPTKTSYKEGDEFDPTGLVVTGTYDDASTDDTMASQAAWSCTPATLTESTTSVTVTATVNGITSEAYVVNGITVTAKTPTGNFALYSGTLVEGDYIIYYEGKAMDASVASNRLQYQEVTPTGNVIAEPDASIVWHIAASGDYYTIYNATEEKYAASNGTKNQAALVASVTDNALWSISYVGGYEFVNKVNAGKDVNANLRNNGTYGFACYSTSTGGALKLYKKTDAATPVREHGATITSAGYATLYLDFAATIPTGVTAYTAVAGDDAVTLTEVEDVIPANTAVVLEGAAGTYTFDEATTTAAAPANDLKGTLVATDWETINNGQYIYVLGQKDGVVGFYKLSETGSIKANSAYLALDEDPASGSIVIRKGDATAISLVQENLGEAVIYDLLGRRVSEPMRGIYIVNGKKMFIK